MAMRMNLKADMVVVGVRWAGGGLVRGGVEVRRETGYDDDDACLHTCAVRPKGK